jgi:hypothetical protein
MIWVVGENRSTVTTKTLIEDRVSQKFSFCILKFYHRGLLVCIKSERKFGSVIAWQPLRFPESIFGMKRLTGRDCFGFEGGALLALVYRECS